MLEILGVCFLIGLVAVLMFSKEGREKLGALVLGVWVLFVGGTVVIAIGAAILFAGLYLLSR